MSHSRSEDKDSKEVAEAGPSSLFSVVAPAVTPPAAAAASTEYKTFASYPYFDPNHPDFDPKNPAHRAFNEWKAYNNIAYAEHDEKIKKIRQDKDLFPALRKLEMLSSPHKFKIEDFISDFVDVDFPVEPILIILQETFGKIQKLMDEQGENELLRAAIVKNLPAVETFLSDEHMDVNKQETKGNGIFYYLLTIEDANKADITKVLECLLNRKDFNIHERSKKGMTPLHYVFALAHHRTLPIFSDPDCFKNIVNLLLAKGARPDGDCFFYHEPNGAASVTVFPPFVIAATQGCDDFLPLLQARSEEKLINRVYPTGDTVLSRVILQAEKTRSNPTSTLETLFKLGADPSQGNFLALLDKLTLPEGIKANIQELLVRRLAVTHTSSESPVLAGAAASGASSSSSGAPATTASTSSAGSPALFAARAPGSAPVADVAPSKASPPPSERRIST